MDKQLLAVKKALAAGDTRQANAMMKHILQNNPSANAYVLAASMVSDEQTKIKLLRKALQLDEWHNEANRQLYLLETPQPLAAHRHEWENKAGDKPVIEIKREKRQLAYQERKQRQRNLTRAGCLFGMVLSMSLSIFALRAIGWLSPQVTEVISVLTGGSRPVYEIEGTPIKDREDAPLRLTPALVKEAAPEGMEVMDAGYLHEHQFEGRAGTEYAIYVQFLSDQANRVSRNVVLLNPFNEDMTYICEKDRILQGDNNITLICILNSTGTWKLRVLGREGESIGAYFIGVQKFDF